MRKFTKEEIEKRSKIVGLSNQLLLLFNEKKEDLRPSWTEVFDKGDIKGVTELHDRTVVVTRKQKDVVSGLIKLFQEEQAELSTETDKHLNYTELVKAHFQFGPGALLAKEESDTQQIIIALQLLLSVLDEQSKILKTSKGSGQQAYSETNLRELLRRENELLQKIQPFWHDWEVVVSQIEGLLENIEDLTQEKWQAVYRDIMLLLDDYHADYSNGYKASQLGTELAVSLYVNPTKELDPDYRNIKKEPEKRGTIPIAVVNIDMTACNNLDESHKLGDEMIQVGYEYLEQELGKDFTKQEDGKPILGDGVVTIWGRTRYKIVGVRKKEIVEALKKLHDSDHIIEELKKPERQGKRFLGTDEEEEFLNLNTRMCVGYAELEPQLSREFRLQMSESLAVIAQLEKVADLGEKTLLETKKQEISDELKKLEREIAKQVDQTLKIAAARAEYLEKELYPKLFEEKLKVIQQKEEEEDVPSAMSLFYKKEERVIENGVLKRFPGILLYDGNFSSEYFGRNYIPEDEFEEGMIKRISHQIGLDTELATEFCQMFENLKVGKDGKLLPNDQVAWDKMKKKFYTQVLQKRHIEKIHDLRLNFSLREDDYDEVVAKMSIIEGSQIMTFIEIDGFNAFNKVYKPDAADTYYHLILKNILGIFESHYNEGKSDPEKKELRMTKQGDEIWLSYPLRGVDGEVSEDEHRAFLEKVHNSMVSRDKGALQVANLRTASWIPYMPLDREETKKHVAHANAKGQELGFVNNSKYLPTEKQGLGHIRLTADNIDKLLKLGSGLDFRLKFSGNKKIEKMEKWKLVDGAREVVNEENEDFGPKTFKYSEMLFAETVKLGVGRASVRAPTGRVIRLGTTIGYAGFDERVLLYNPDFVNRYRKALNKSVEIVRKKKGRGEVWNLQSLGITKPELDKALKNKEQFNTDLGT